MTTKPTPTSPSTGDSSPTEDIRAGSEPRLVRRFRLRIVDGPDSGRIFTSAGEKIVVGTHRRADLVLTDPTASRFHCEIEVQEQQVLVRDLESTNGTLVDGTSVLVAHLTDGAAITAGRTNLRFELGLDHVVLPLHPETRFHRMVGQSLAMRSIFALLERAADTEMTVLLGGETGTGKDVAAESIHLASSRSGGPFVVVDCGALPHDLIESELFGHRRGAFTGAEQDRVGAFESADGGTLFLDEIGELDPELQPKLLRALEQREVMPVGGQQPTPVDVRVIAATNRDLRAEVNARRFRSDLFYRIAVFEVALPPLRDRREDIPLLVDELLARLQISEEDAAGLRTPEFYARLSRHVWPGNVRELRNYVEQSALIGQPMPFGPRLGHDQDDAPPIDADAPLRVARERWIASFERRYLEALLARTGDNVTEAARRAGVDRSYLHRLLTRAGLR
jgi:two-component system, NtrC family, response regulator GlrR